MTAISIQAPFPAFADRDGQPLENGYIHIGVVNLNPIVNPVAVFFDAALTIPAVQPIRTLDGYPVYQGTPAVIYVNSDYSILVQDKKGTTVYSAPAATERYNADVITSVNMNALDVIYNPAGSSAVQTNVQTKLREYVSVKDFGAIGDGVTDDTNAIQSAINENPGKNIFFPRGVYSITSITVSNNNTTLIGEGSTTGGSILQPANTTGNDVTFTGCQFSGIQKMGIFPVVKKTNGFAVFFTNNTFRCQVTNVNVNYVYNGFGFVGATESVITNSQCRYLLGSYGIYFGGTVSSGSFRLVIDNFGADNPYPGPYGPVKTYAATTAFVLNEIAAANGVIWQCSQSGTTGTIAPFGYPGTTAQTVFSDEITDGTVKWKFVCVSDLYWIVQDSYSYSLVIDKAACLNGARGYAMEDYAATGTSYPIWTFAWDLETDHSFITGVHMEAGEGLYIDGSWIGSCLSGNGVVIDSSSRGEVFIGAGTRIMGHAQNGILINAGAKTVNIDGCLIGLNSQKTINLFNGITVAGGVIDFSITNNRIGDLTGTGFNPQAAGIFLLPGATNKFIIANNNLLDNISTAIQDNSTGTTKRIANNLGYNPGIDTAIVVGASPFSFTNNTGNDITVFVQAGTVSQVALNGYAVASSTFQAVVTPQGSVITVTYTVAPVMLFKIH